MLKKIHLHIKFRDLVYFGVPLLVVITSAIFPVKPILQQSMVAFVLIWFIGGLWLISF
jgi:hypothetical protein